jgi:predicted nucleotidyltransferase
MMYGLKTETIHAIQEVLLTYPEVEKAILYGSRAKGNYRPGSDIDLTLTGETLNLTILQKIENELDDLLLPYKICSTISKGSVKYFTKKQMSKIPLLADPPPAAATQKTNPAPGFLC